MFKTRKITNASSRKVSKESDVEVVDGDENNCHDIIARIRHEQSLRSKNAGILLALNGSTTTKEDDIAGKSVGREDKFQKQVETDSLKLAHERLMEEYINAKMGVPKQMNPPRIITAEDELYILPDELRVKDDDIHNKNNSGRLAWSTGIAEVALPASFKHKNIEQTMKAKIELGSKMSATVTDSRGLGGVRFGLYGIHSTREASDKNEQDNHVPIDTSRDVKAEANRVIPETITNFGLEQIKKRHRQFDK